jgi:LysR family hydrogen peroxide-inducible transcriptional activator
MRRVQLMNLSGLSLRDLEYVVAVADHGSFVRAAEQCHVAQPSLSMQVSKVEARLNTPIFERTTRRLIVTSNGQRVVEQMRRVLVEARAIFALAGKSQKPFGGVLRLSAISTLGPYVFPCILRDLRSRYPGLSLVLGEGKTEDLLRALIQGDIDAALVSTHRSEAGVTGMPIFHEPFVLACPEDHPACATNGGGWEGLAAGERLLLDEGHCLRDQALAACSDIAPSNRHATSLETLKYMVAAGEGCTLIPIMAANDAMGIKYAPLPIERYSRVIHLVWRHSDPRVTEFKDLAALLGPLAFARHPTVQPFGALHLARRTFRSLQHKRTRGQRSVAQIE